MATEAEIAWAAGLFEGEGCLRITNARGKSTCALIHLSMTDRDTVQRFRDIVGAGRVWGPTDRGPGRKPMYGVDIAQRPAVKQTILAFLPWLGARRTAKAQELLALIEVLDAAAAQREQFCKRGHPWTAENTYTTPSGIRACKTCKVTANREWSRVKRATDPEFVQKNRDASRAYARRKRAGAKLAS